ncbi:D-mannonate dehydratase ManD [Streptomyces sp. NPDC127084]|uniref:D-mannonate dehydratase ManD n=1 Tax=Streptomyces sp. NPDC127084 TaxID=3347133 RepID=UPI003669B6E4
MRIVDAEVVVTSPGRNYVLLKLTTSDGHTGWGDATLNGRELAVAAYLSEHVLPLLDGRDASRITDTWGFLYRGAYWRRGPVTMTAISAVDQALWDIKGKAAGLPVYELLGGRCRDGVTVYGHASGAGIEETVAGVQDFLDRGYRAVRAQSRIPGLVATYGIGTGVSEVYEPAVGAVPMEEIWETGPYLDFVPRMMARIRAELGYGFDVLHDAHHRLTPIQAATLGRSLEPYRLFWLEDPTPAEDQSAFRVIRSHTITPLAVGEVFNSVWDCQQLIGERLIDYVRTSVTHAGGITHVRRIFDFADLHGVQTGAHGAGDLSPVGIAANLHVDMAIPNFGIQEYMGHVEPTARVFDVGYHYSEGMLHVSDRPGLGVDVNEDAARAYPYVPRQLPVVRLRDGSMHNW